MRAITHALLADEVLPPGAVVDLGCGGGALLAEMRARFDRRPCFGLDLHPQAVKQSSRVMAGRVMQADLSRLPLDDGAVALLLALDSFDQTDVDLLGALNEARRVLCVNGLLVARVSAGSWLFGPHDIAFNTERRHDRRSLMEEVSAVGLRIERCTYANLLMAPPVVLLRSLQRAGFLPLSTSLYTNSFVNRGMAMLLKMESQFLQAHDLPFGLSLYILARKETS